MSYKPKKPPKDYKVKESDLMPYDSLISNRGYGGDSNMYMQSEKGKRQNLSFSSNPQDAFNAPPWLSDTVKTMGDERNQLAGPDASYQGLQKHEDELSRGGLTRDDQHSEYGGANIFARMKERQQKEKMGNGMGWWQKKNAKKRTFLAHTIR
jgi:hypothetical protein